jgi:hypothetical protein
MWIRLCTVMQRRYYDEINEENLVRAEVALDGSVAI